MALKNIWVWMRSFIGAVTLIFATSCAGLLDKEGAAFPSSFAEYVRGDLYSTEEVSLQRAAKAIPQGLKDLGYRVSQQDVDKEFGIYIAEGTGEKLIRISIKKQTRILTEIRIRVGLDGDEPLSRFILAKIKTRF